MNDEMVAAGVRVFVGGLRPRGEARLLGRGRTGGRDRGELPAGGGVRRRVWVLEVADLEAALA